MNIFNYALGVPAREPDNDLDYSFEYGLHFNGFIWIEGIPEAVIKQLKNDSSIQTPLLLNLDLESSSMLLGTLVDQVTLDALTLNTDTFAGEVEFPVPTKINYVNYINCSFYDTSERALSKLFRLWIFSLYPDILHYNEPYKSVSKDLQLSKNKLQSHYATIVVFSVNEELNVANAIGGVGIPTVVPTEDLIFKKGNTEIYKFTQTFRGIFTMHSKFEKIVQKKLIPNIKTVLEAATRL